MGTQTNGTSGSETPKRTSKKRKRKPETWGRNVAKTKRAKGLAYVSPCSNWEDSTLQSYWNTLKIRQIYQPSITIESTVDKLQGHFLCGLCARCITFSY